MLLSGVVVLSFLSKGCATSPKAAPELFGRATGVYHTVQRGETLWRIATSYHIEPERITTANKLPDPSKIAAGQLLYIPTKTAQPYLQKRPPVRESGQKDRRLPVAFGWPVRGKVISYFGGQTLYGRNRGINILGKEGEAVLASEKGIVVFAGEKVKGFGKMIILDHGNHLQSLYAHNKELLVQEGDQVTKRQPIAQLGKTGRTKVPTLHFEIRRFSRPQNPLTYLKEGPL